MQSKLIGRIRQIHKNMSSGEAKERKITTTVFHEGKYLYFTDFFIGLTEVEIDTALKDHNFISDYQAIDNALTAKADCIIKDIKQKIPGIEIYIVFDFDIIELREYNYND